MSDDRVPGDRIGPVPPAAGQPGGDDWNRNGGQSYQRGESFGQGGYGAYGSQPSGDEPAAAPSPSIEGDSARVEETEADEGDAGGDTPVGRHQWQREAMTAGEIGTTHVRAVTRASTLDEIAQLMKAEDCGMVPVVDDSGRVVGVVTDRDLVVRAAAAGRSFDDTRADEVMTDEVEAVTPDEEIPAVIELMGRRQIRRVLVVDGDDRLQGIISMADVAGRTDYDEELQLALQRISSRRRIWSRLL